MPLINSSGEVLQFFAIVSTLSFSAWETMIRTNENRLRVLYSLLRAPVALAQAIELPLKALTTWIELAYFHRLREAGYTLDEASDALGVSKRKASMLSSQLKRNFFDPEVHHGLPRRIEFLLWAERMSAQRIHQLLGADHATSDIAQALEQLVTEERIERRGEGVGERYALSRERSRMYRDDFMVRIDGLNDVVDLVARAIYSRFFRDSREAFARTVTFYAVDEDIELLPELYEELFEKLAEIDARASRSTREARPVQLSVIWDASSFDEMTNEQG